MSTRRGDVYILRVENARDRMAAAWRRACDYLELGLPVRVELGEFKSTRSLEQNAKFHAMCGDIAKQLDWAGKKRDIEAWKRLLVDAWARTEKKNQCEIVPSLDNESVVALGIQTRSMRVSEMAELITFVQWYGDEHGVRWGDPTLAPDDESESSEAA